MSEPPFHIGQRVYVPWADAYKQEVIPCSICAGQRSVVLILGSGERVSVACGACGRGYEGPTGTEIKYGPASGIHTHEVTGLQRIGERWRILIGEHQAEPADNVFHDEESAEIRRAALHAEAEAQATRNWESQFKNKRKDHAWTVQYHRKCIADLERQLAWHRSKVVPRP